MEPRTGVSEAYPRLKPNILFVLAFKVYEFDSVYKKIIAVKIDMLKPEQQAILILQKLSRPSAFPRQTSSMNTFSYVLS